MASLSLTCWTKTALCFLNDSHDTLVPGQISNPRPRPPPPTSTFLWMGRCLIIKIHCRLSSRSDHLAATWVLGKPMLISVLSFARSCKCPRNMKLHCVLPSLLRAAAGYVVVILKHRERLRNHCSLRTHHCQQRGQCWFVLQ